MVLSKNKLQGFTLLELVLYMAIAAVVLSTISSLIFILWQARIKNQAISEVEQQGMYAINYLSRSIMQADAVLSPNKLTSESILRLELTSAGLGEVNFFENNGRLAVIENNGNIEYLTGENLIIKNLNFGNFSKPLALDMIRITFSLEAKSNSDRNEYTYQTNFYSSQSIQK